MGLKIAICDPYHGGSHRVWARELAQCIEREPEWECRLFTLPGKHWKWRMHGAAATFAHLLEAESPFDVLITTDMLDAAQLRGLLPPHQRQVQLAVYFHENQLTFPWSPEDQDRTNGRDRTYGHINIVSALAADAVWFNSSHHKSVFLDAVKRFYNPMPDARLRHAHETITNRSQVLPIGLNLSFSDRSESKIDPSKGPVFLWNHRWEYDKNPAGFFAACRAFDAADFPFQLIVVGQEFAKAPVVFAEAKKRWSDRLVHWGWVESRSEYLILLGKAHFLVHAPDQEYFGISVMEAMAAGVVPLVKPGLAYDDYLPKEWTSLEKAEEAPALVREKMKHWQQDSLAAQRIARGFAWSALWPSYKSAIARLAQ
jgi:glycosyltransferase involved in cell wall biosynthesis